MMQKFTKILSLIALTAMSNLLEAQMKWSPAGPVYTAGRARNMIVDKNDASNNTLYVGSTSSGIFKSTNGGVTWAPIDDQGSVRNISYMAQAPDGTIYAATGEGFLRLGQKAKALPGSGLYKLNGSSLVQMATAASVGTVINRIAINPQNSSNIALATNLGILISNDGGTSFNLASGIPVVAGTNGQDVKFDAAGNLFCSVGSEAGSASSTLTASKIYKSTSTALSSFLDITPPQGALSDQNYGRIELGIAPSDNNVIYASIANKNSDGKNSYSASLKGLFVSYNAGLNWGLIVQGSAALDPLSYFGFISSGDYAQVLVVSATDPNTLLFGGYSFCVWKRRAGAAGGSNSNPIGDWVGPIGSPAAKNTPYYLHENIHDIKVISGNPAKYYFITDAGIYRSTDLATTTQTLPPSFQPFYQGLVTGQFNSVSIERFPVGENVGSTAAGTKITPNVGFIGGTGGNGVTYYSGTYSLVTQESSYMGGDIYNVEYSKILPNAAYVTSGSGNINRSANMKTSSPITYSVNKFTGALSKLAPEPNTFTNKEISTGTPFKLWEYYGQLPNNPDKIYYYNDSLRFQTSVATVTDLATVRTFTINTNRPGGGYAAIDSIVVRTATLAIAQTTNPPAFTTGKTVTIKLNNNYTNTGSLTVLTGTTLVTTGYIGTDSPTITLNNNSLSDDIVVPFLSPPFGDKTLTSTTPGHYRVYATVFYKFNAGDSVSVVDNNISTLINTYKAVYPSNGNWRYGSSAPAFTVPVTPNAAVSNPTYVVAPVNITSTTLPISVNLVGVRSLTVTQYGDYTMTAKPVVYTLSVTSDTNIPSAGAYTFDIQPGGETHTVSSTSTASVIFTVIPTANTDYTITQTGTGTLTSVTNFSVNASTYQLDPGAITQSSPIFTVNITPSSSVVTFTASGISSNTLLGDNTTSTLANFPVKSVSNVGSTVVTIPANNQPIKIPMRYSARLAVAVANPEITGGEYAVAVSKNPLALNDPGNFVRVSQSGCMTDDASGNPTTNVINIPGRPTILEWSKSGTELYYATDANNVYRVSHITDIMDLSQSSYSGKFYTDVFMYNTGTGNVPTNSNLNMNSPYRTTLLGSFDKPVTSISVSNDDSKMVLTFNNPTQTGTTGIVMYSDNSNIKTASNIAWVKKDNGLSNLTTYCSMIEKDDLKLVFVGTDKGLYSTTDITTGVWSNVNATIANDNDKIPNVQVFDIKQQVINPSSCYNSGQIYVATNGRGVWTNASFLKYYYVGVQEETANNSANEALHIYPNPSNGSVYIDFEGWDNQNVDLSVLDLSGRVVKSFNIGQIQSSDFEYSIETNDMTAGIYFVTLRSDAGMKRTAKLIVTK